ncbi:FAD-dependent monooxygenase [Couchioplanes caeruleus]|uniref:FAD-dependent oxidoreductase n=1 Tax=Couchioplanes caeruleus TaxID=56438 RepID=UPI0020BFECD5|nr:NAD(P)/FAD-dependent oxidoreductase [Couchioplanes caeruleus]UQU64730.1 FAD-dependent monooxygenase [Couchioplanes caeruleus]
MRVLIAGAGLGGLCLAHGLHRAGVDVEVFERAASPDAFAAGYRIHIDPDGDRALRSCLPSRQVADYEAACGRPPRTFAFVDERLRELLTAEIAPPGADSGHRSINRYRLRRILLSGLDERVRFGREIVGFEEPHEVNARFADGSAATGTVLIGAEGTHSPTRAQLLPHAERVDTGVDGISGRVVPDGPLADLVPSAFADGPGLVLAPGGRNLFVATHEDYLVWGLSARRETLPAGGIGGLSPDGLHCLARELTARWHPRLRHLVDAAKEVSGFTIKTSVPVPPWPAGRVTVLGDAIHSMPPSRGIGANTALRDADLLRRTLTGGGDPVAAIAAYEREMRAYGFAAVRASVQAQRQGLIANRPAFAMSKAALRMLNALPSVRDRVFR